MRPLKILEVWMQRPDGLNERQILAAQALASGCSWRMLHVGPCSVETIRAWRKQTDFNETIWLYQQEIFQQSFGVTSEALPMAIAKLREIVGSDDPDMSVGVKVQAIKILIDSAQKQYETRTIERRIEQLKVMQGRLLSKLNQLERLHQEKIQAEEKRKLENTASYSAPASLPVMSGRFAPLTWIKTSGTIKPFKPFKIQQELVQSICDDSTRSF